MNCDAGRNYYVRPGQVLGPEKFCDEDSKTSYIRIKHLSKILDADLNMYWVKKEFRTLGKESKLYSANLFELLSRGKFKTILEDKIDFEKWEKSRSEFNIPLKDY